LTKEQKKLLDSELAVINIGMTIFFDALQVHNIKVIQVEWKTDPKHDKLSEEIL
jgi:hypothetical protein